MNLKKTLVTFAAALVVVPMAFAHAHPKVMLPAADSTGPAPARIIVTFSEAVEAKFSSLSVTDENGTQINKEKSVADATDKKTLTLALPALAPGEYLVHWVTVAPDGHKMTGEYKFTVK